MAIDIERLIGKKVIRLRPAKIRRDYGRYYLDYSYCINGLRFYQYNDWGIISKINTDKSFYFAKNGWEDARHILSSEWNDGAWVEYVTETRTLIREYPPAVTVSSSVITRGRFDGIIE